MSLIRRIHPVFLLALAVCGTQLLGCGDDDGAQSDAEAGKGGRASGSAGKPGGSEGGAATNEGGAAGAPAESKAGLYLVAKHVSTGDAWTTYVDTASVEKPSELADFDALKDGLEVQGYSVPVVRSGSVFVPDALAPTVTRYEADESGELVEGKTISFARAGITEVFAAVMVFVSDEKAYVLDVAGQRAVAWNPAEMVLIGKEIDLRNPEREGYSPWFWGDAARVKNGKLLVPVDYTDDDDVGLRESTLLVIDTDKDELNKYVSDPRCGRLHVAVDVGDDTYYFPNAGHAADEYLDVPAPRPPTCGLRVNAGEDTFDSEYVLDFAALTGGDETKGGGAQGGFPDGHGGFYFAVADEARYAEAEQNGYAYFRLWHYDLETATELKDAAWWTAAMSRQTRFENQSLVISYGLSGEQEVTIVYEGSSQPLSSFDMPGTIEPVARLR